MKSIPSLVVSIGLVGCTTLSPVPYTASAPHESLRAGDRVRLGLHDGSEKRLVIARVTASEVCATQECVRADEIATVQHEKLDGKATAIGTLKVAGYIAYFALIGLSGLR